MTYYDNNTQWLNHQCFVAFDLRDRNQLFDAAVTFMNMATVVVTQCASLVAVQGDPRGFANALYLSKFVFKVAAVFPSVTAVVVFIDCCLLSWLLSSPLLLSPLLCCSDCCCSCCSIFIVLLVTDDCINETDKLHSRGSPKSKSSENNNNSSSPISKRRKAEQKEAGLAFTEVVEVVREQFDATEIFSYFVNYESGEVCDPCCS